MFLLLRNKHSLPVFSLQCSRRQLSASVPQALPDVGGGAVTGLRLFSGFCFIALNLFPAGSEEPQCPHLLPLSKLQQLWMLTPTPLITGAQAFSWCSPHTSTDNLTLPAHSLQEEEGKVLTQREGQHDPPTTFQQVNSRAGIRTLLSSCHW